jgi:glycosyltransferase involved in cell wall biosynthesis
VAIPTPRPKSLIEAARARIQERRAAAAPPVLGWLGRCSEEKGFSTFFAAVRQFMHEHPSLPCSVLIQYLVGPDGCVIPESEIDALAASDSRIRLLKESVSGDAYGRLLGELDCLVLPYQRSKYIGRNSSAALDAVLVGIPIITTEGTWMAELLEHHGAGLTAKDRDEAALAQGFRLIIEDFDKLSVDAWTRSDAARSRISWTQFAQTILSTRQIP